MWSNTVLTDSGIELIKNTMTGDTITLTAVKSGTGKVEAGTLGQQTAVTDVKQNGTIQSIKNEQGTISVLVLFENTGLEKGYTMNQIGIYAKKDQGEILFAITQDAVGKEIPSESSMPYYSLVSRFNFSFSNDLNITSEVDPIGYVKLEAFEEHTGNKTNPHAVTKSQVGLGNVENVKVNDHAVTFSDISDLETIASGEKASSVFPKIKLAITKLISHLSSTENPHKVTKSQVGLGNVENKSASTILSGLSSRNVTTALGFTPAKKDDLDSAVEKIGKIKILASEGYKKINFYEEFLEFESDGKTAYTKEIEESFRNVYVFAYSTIDPVPGAFSATISKKTISTWKIKVVSNSNSTTYISGRLFFLIFSD